MHVAKQDDSTWLCTKSHSSLMLRRSNSVRQLVQECKVHSGPDCGQNSKRGGSVPVARIVQRKRLKGTQEFMFLCGIIPSNI